MYFVQSKNAKKKSQLGKNQEMKKKTPFFIPFGKNDDGDIWHFEIAKKKQMTATSGRLCKFNCHT